MMADLIRNAVNRLKKVSIGVWFVCALVVLVGGWLVAVITKPPSQGKRTMHDFYRTATAVDTEHSLKPSFDCVLHSKTQCH